MLSFINGLGCTFHACPLTETTQDLGNPGRGWYRIYTYRIGEEEPEVPVFYENETIALVLMNVGAYRERDLDQESITVMDGILERFESAGMDLILRICYDTEGKGMVREPSLFSQVKNHLSQLGPLLEKHAEHLLVFQGLLVGNWGEMHESKFLIPNCIREMTETFFRATKGRVRLAVRKPVQYRTAFSEAEKPGRIGFFNDGMLGSASHLGTFGAETAGRGAWKEAFSPEEEIRFMEPFLREVPYGGEALMPPTEMTPEETVATLRDLKVTYLNSTHEERLLNKWRQTPYGDGSLYDYVGARLGYRFLVRSASAKLGKDLEVKLEIQNDGFGGLCEETELTAWALMRGQQEWQRIGHFEGGLQGTFYGQSKSFHGHFDKDFLGDGKSFCAELGLLLTRKRDGRAIRFAQESNDALLPLGTLQKGR